MEVSVTHRIAPCLTTHEFRDGRCVKCGSPQPLAMTVMISHADREWMDEVNRRSVERHVAAMHIRRG